MTDRLKGFTVVLEQDIREDDAEPIKAAIEQMRGVLTVKPIVANAEDYFSRERVKRELVDKLLAVLK